MNQIDKQFIEEIEKAHFRTQQDTGANLNALLIWNCVRKHVGLPRLNFSDLPEYCTTHKCYHKIDIGAGCSIWIADAQK